MCGIVSILATDEQNIATSVYDALTIIQHRGQDAAGIVSTHNGRFYMRKAKGLVRNVFRTSHMISLVGNVAIGHVRYPTAGTTSSAEAQPFYVNSPYGIAFVHNGNLTNTDALTKELIQVDKRHINTDSDSEIMLNILASELSKKNSGNIASDIFAAVSKLNERVSGGYACIASFADHKLMLAFRDPNGIRPLILGKRDKGDHQKYMFASESVALTALGYEVIADIAPGHAVIVKGDGEILSQQCALKVAYHPCIFEFVYFARPDSIIDKISVYKSRLRMGQKLAVKIKREWQDESIDVVIPIPDTSRTAALELASVLNIKYREGFIKNRYIARTFIMPEQKVRKKSVRQKLSAIALEFKGKNVLLVDDSIVRGTTSKQIVQMARGAGAKQVFFASAAPAVRYPNVYGIDMPRANELIAYHKTIAEIGEIIGADRLIYQDLDDLIWSVKQGNENITQFDTSCFNGKYVTGDVNTSYLKNIAKKRYQNLDVTADVVCTDIKNG